ncbi:unnamed protein product [Aspergillus oryzae]|nr:unnamed protein product [Aspergillus oryzae]
MSIKYLITRATGGLGGQVLEYFASFIPLSKFAAASSKPENKSCFDNRYVTLDIWTRFHEYMVRLSHVKRERCRTNHSSIPMSLVNKFVHQGPAANGGKHHRLVEAGIVKPP